MQFIIIYISNERGKHDVLVQKIHIQHTSTAKSKLDIVYNVYYCTESI